MDSTTDLARPWGERLRTWREQIKGWSRAEFIEEVTAAAFRLNEERGHDLTPRLVGRWESNEVKRPQGVYRRILAHMGAPLPAMSATRSAASLPSKWPGAASLTSDDGDMRRRQFLTATGFVGVTAAATATEPWQRLANALAGTNRPDAATVAMIEKQTQSLFDLEERMSAHQVVGEANDHLDRISAILYATENESLRNQLTSQAGASAALAGWLAYDQGAFDTAKHYYQVAEQAAHQAGDAPLMACVTTYRSYLADSLGNQQEGARLLRSAIEMLPPGGQPEMKAWLSAREAETAAILGQRDEALRAFDRAYTAQEFSRQAEQPLWTKFFTPTRLDGMAIASYARLNHTEMEAAAQRLLQSIDTCSTKVEQIALADLSYGYLELGDIERGAEYGQSALNAIRRSNTRVGYDRLAIINRALMPYRNSRIAAGFHDQITETLRTV